MDRFMHWLLAPAQANRLRFTLFILRVGLGVLTIGHGIPKIMGGFEEWQKLGTFIYPMGIQFLPTVWGFLGAITEFFGGIMLVLGLGTRIASLALTFMMIVAAVWHIDRGDDYMIYSFPLTLVVVFFSYMMMGSDKFSVDYYLTKRQRGQQV